MDDAFGYEERDARSDETQLSTSGDYLCIQHEDQPRYIYRRVPAGMEPHPLVSSKIHNGELYSLAWIEDDKE